jgi:hypothetical protein
MVVDKGGTLLEFWTGAVTNHYGQDVGCALWT